ncbi:MAG: LysR substrate-binding domain-containing protein [Alphaproteobacteria bacterium]|nr:LysR substrate-binding domain-containing protein [Alphaproteobacteria bacterium]
MRRRLPPLRAIRCFEAAADHENLVVAADMLGVTKGAVSQQIKLLEQYLGVALFDRAGRGLALTDAGRRYHSAVRTSLATLERATDQIARQRSRGTFRLTVLPAFASMWLVHRLADYQERHPNIDIEISADAAMVDFSRSDAHLGIRYAKGDATGLSVRILGHDRLFPVCSPAYRDAQRIGTAADLARCRLLHDTYWHDDWTRWAAGTGTALPNLQEGQYFTLYSVAIDAARSGGGVAMGHALLVGDMLARGDLVRPFAESVTAREPYVLVRPARADHLDFVRAFERWIADRLAGTDAFGEGKGEVGVP